jgi:membrane protease YdiL (CAAX protease family)
MTFTAVFGAMACRVFSRTESLAAATACHSACNLIGAPSAASFRDARGIAAHVLGVVCAMAALTFF